MTNSILDLITEEPRTPPENMMFRPANYVHSNYLIYTDTRGGAHHFYYLKMGGHAAVTFYTDKEDATTHQPVIELPMFPIVPAHDEIIEKIVDYIESNL